MGLMAQDSRVRNRDAAYSTGFNGTSIWVYGDTSLTVVGADGDAHADNTSNTRTDLNAADGIAAGVEKLDSAGAPSEYIPRSNWERFFNQVNDPDVCGTPSPEDPNCGQQYFNWPGQLVADPARNRVISFLSSGIRCGSIPCTAPQWWGAGVATWSPGGQWTRQETGPPPDVGGWDTGILFGPGDEFGSSAAVVVGTTLYAYDCDPGSGWYEFNCFVARVALADVTNRAAWRFFAGGSTWSTNIADAVEVFDGATANTVYFNTYLNKYMVVYGFDTVKYRTADNPWGPWSDPGVLFNAVPVNENGKLNYSAVAHPEYGSGQTFYVTYIHPTSVGGGTRLVRVNLQ